MRYFSVLVTCAVLAASGVQPGFAQSEAATRLPAEFPPASYTGRQYVDSDGCAFVRAGINGQVTWVPRLTRNRQVVCGFEPTIPDGTGTRAAVRSAPEPVEIIVPEPAATQVVPKAKPTKPAAVRRTAVKPAKAAPLSAGAKCKNASAKSNAFLIGSDKHPVRCGPQSEKVTGGSAKAVVKVGKIAPNVRVAPKHVYEEQKRSQAGISVPQGYEPVWKDDRLNPKRAHQTLAGKAQMERVWTKRVPRTLVRKTTDR